jgi:hypothetical protein
MKPKPLYPRWMQVMSIILLSTVFLLAAVTQIDLTTQVKGTLPVTNGGTGSTSSTGSGAVVLATSPTITTPIISGALGGNLDFGTAQAAVVEVANAGTTGTTVNKLAKYTGAPGTAVIAATTDTKGVIGVVVGGAGTTSNAQIATYGFASCVFDGATTAGDYVQISGSVTGDCHDGGNSYPTTGQVLGRIPTTNGAGGTYAMLLFGPEIQGSSPATINFADAETPAGTIDGSNAVFTLAFTPSPAGSLQLYKNGQQMIAGGADYTLSTNTITYVAGAKPKTGDVHIAFYRR